MKKYICVVFFVCLAFCMTACGSGEPKVNAENVELGGKALLMADQYFKGNIAAIDARDVIMSYIDDVAEEADGSKDKQIELESRLLLLSTDIFLGNDEDALEWRNEIAKLIGEERTKMSDY